MKSLLAIFLSVAIALPILFSLQPGQAQAPAPLFSISFLSPSDTEAIFDWIANETSAEKAPYCYRQSYGRGAGEVLSTCKPGEEKKGALCYPNCREGYKADDITPYVCSQTCPQDFVSSGVLTCLRNTRVVKGVRASCESGWTTFPLTCTRRRLPLITRSRPLTCPAGYRNDGVQCWLDAKTITRDTYGRGVGTPLGCRDGLEQDGGLCYSNCRAGYNGVGPVCWQNCNPGTFSCGAGCTKDKSSCVNDTFNQVISPVQLALNIISFGGSGTVSGKVGAAFKVAKTKLEPVIEIAKTADTVTKPGVITASLLKASVDALGDFAEAYAQNMSEMTTENVVKTLKANFNESQYRLIVRSYALKQFQIAAQDLAIDTLRSLSPLDPTGVAGVIEAFAKPICKKNAPFPQIRIL